MQLRGDVGLLIADAHVKHRERALAPIGQRDLHHITGPRPHKRLANRRAQRDRTLLITRSPPADQHVPRRPTRVILNPHQRAKPRAITRRRLIDHPRRGDQALKLRDPHMLDRHILKHREPLIIIPRTAERPRIPKPLRKLSTMRTTQMLELAHELIKASRGQRHLRGRPDGNAHGS